VWNHSGSILGFLNRPSCRIFSERSSQWLKGTEYESELKEPTEDEEAPGEEGTPNIMHHQGAIVPGAAPPTGPAPAGPIVPGQAGPIRPMVGGQPPAGQPVRPPVVPQAGQPQAGGQVRPPVVPQAGAPGQRPPMPQVGQPQQRPPQPPQQ